METQPEAGYDSAMLREIDMPKMIDARLSAQAKALLEEADRRIDAFTQRQDRRLIHNFVASDFRAVDACLQWIVEQHLLAGRTFCEWGSGFGVVTMLAALRGFDACGIEVEPELVEQACQLAEDMEIPVQFAEGSVIPAGGDKLIGNIEEVDHIDIDSPGGYDELGLDVSDFDLFFAFPWPGETQFWDKLFNRYAADGALLLTYHGIEEFRLQRRVRKQK